MSKKIPEEIREAVIKDYNNNVSAEETSKKYNIGISAIANIRNQYNISVNENSNIKIQCNDTIRYKRLSASDSYDDAKINGIINDYKNGVKTIDICVRHSISDCMLYKILQVNNIALDRRKITTKEQEQEIIKLYLDGYPVKYIYEKLNVSKSTMERILNKNNIPKRRSKIKYKITDKDTINSIIDDYLNSDLYIAEIHKKYGISNTTLENLLIRNNVPKRTSVVRKKSNK